MFMLRLETWIYIRIGFLKRSKNRIKRRKTRKSCGMDAKFEKVFKVKTTNTKHHLMRDAQSSVHVEHFALPPLSYLLMRSPP